MRCDLILKLNDGEKTSYVRLNTCIGFSFEKALYVPYTKLNALYYVDGQPSFKASHVMGVRFTIDNYELHYGMPDKISIVKSGHGYRVRVTSRGYTLLLAQNEPYPRINANVTLKSLCSNNLECSTILYEDPTPTVRNIYVNDGSTVWDAVVAYCIKASGRYPYIFGTNTVRMTIDRDEDMDYTNKLITERTEATESSMLLSDVYMRELDEDYPFEAHDGSAANMGIVRSKYYPLDMQWLYDPQTGLQHKLDYSNRGVRVYGLTYRGYQREDIMDRVVGGGEEMNGMRINYVRVVGSKKGVFTTVRAYDDRYGQK